MAGPLSEDERKMIEDEGLTVDRFREKFDEAGQEDLDRENWRDMVSLWKNRPTRMEDVKMKRIIEVCSSRGGLLSTDVQLLTPAGAD